MENDEKSTLGAGSASMQQPADWLEREQVFRAVEVRYQYLLSLFVPVARVGDKLEYQISVRLPAAATIEEAVELSMLEPVRREAAEIEASIYDQRRLSNGAVVSGNVVLSLPPLQAKALAFLKQGISLKPDLTGKVIANGSLVCARADMVALCGSGLTATVRDSAGCETWAVTEAGRLWVAPLT